MSVVRATSIGAADHCRGGETLRGYTARSLEVTARSGRIRQMKGRTSVLLRTESRGWCPCLQQLPDLVDGENATVRAHAADPPAAEREFDHRDDVEGRGWNGGTRGGVAFSVNRRKKKATAIHLCFCTLYGTLYSVLVQCCTQ